jgi:hypothetical protein
MICDEKGEVEETFLQKRGQLMGSPISFPILCIYNAALSRYAMELRAGRQLDLDEMPMLVNGDDLLLQTDEVGFRYWKEVTRFGGLRCSIGKTYLSPNIMTLNSELWFARRKTEKLSDPKRENYSSGTVYWSAERQIIPLMGLTRGSIKGGKCHNGWRSTDLPFEVLSNETSLSSFNLRGSLSQRWTDFVRSCPDKNRAWDYMWREQFDFIRRSPRGTACCLPTWLGGLGVPLPPTDHPFYQKRLPSSGQRILANYILQNWLGAPGNKIRAITKRTGSPQYLQILQNEDVRIRTALGCQPQIVKPNPSHFSLSFEAEPLVPFSMTGFLSSGSLAPENISVPTPRNKMPRGAQNKAQKQRSNEESSMSEADKACKRDYKIRLQMWNDLCREAQRSKLAPLPIQRIPTMAPCIGYEAYAVV